MMIRGLNKITDASGLGYLMSSYTSNPGGPEAAEGEAQTAAAELKLAGLVVFAPIAYGPGIERKMQVFKEDLKHIQTHEFWMPIDERFYQRCDYGVIAMTPGWDKSTGIAIEVYALARRGVPLYAYDINEGHILTLSEAMKLYPHEFEALFQKCAEEGSPYYLAEFSGDRSSLLAEMLSKAEVNDRLRKMSAMAEGRGSFN